MERIILQGITVSELREIIRDTVELELDKVLKKYQGQETYTVKQAAHYLQCSELTVRNYITKGYLNAFRIGRSVIIKGDDMEKAMTEIKSLKYRR